MPLICASKNTDRHCRRGPRHHVRSSGTASVSATSTATGRTAPSSPVDYVSGPGNRHWAVTLHEQEAELFDMYPNYDAAIAAAEAALRYA